MCPLLGEQRSGVLLHAVGWLGCWEELWKSCSGRCCGENEGNGGGGGTFEGEAENSEESNPLLGEDAPLACVLALGGSGKAASGCDCRGWCFGWGLILPGPAVGFLQLPSITAGV